MTAGARQLNIRNRLRSDSMRKLFKITALATLLSAPTAFAHHPAADIVDPEIYAMIDSMVADTPHADMVFTDMGGGMTEITVNSRDLRTLENLIDEGVLEYASMLDGDVDVAIDFVDNGSVALTISQSPR
jgi:hypothetical protein